VENHSAFHEKNRTELGRSSGISLYSPAFSMALVKEKLVYTLGIIQNPHIIKSWAILLDKCLMCWVLENIVVSLLLVAEFDHEAMCEASLCALGTVVPASRGVNYIGLPCLMMDTEAFEGQHVIAKLFHLLLSQGVFQLEQY